MAIYTRYGSEVVIFENCGEGIAGIRRLTDGREFDVHISELKADNGSVEIGKAFDAAPKAQKQK